MPAVTAGPGGKRRYTQQRAIESRQALLEAALVEFAERGFEGASTRNISQRAGLKQPLLTYHFGNKEDLWKAVATHFFAEITSSWAEAIPADARMSAADRVRVEFRMFLRFTLEHPDFHHFMLRENQPGSPRLLWLVENMLAPIMSRILPQIRAAQEEGDLLQADPVLIYYALIGVTSVLSSLGGEMRETSAILSSDPNVVEAYWNIIEQTLLPKTDRSIKNTRRQSA